MKLFVSYRHEDAGGSAGRLYDRLAAAYGQRHVYYDVATNRAGQNFVARITAAVSRCTVLLVVIGPNWTSIEGKSGARRLDEPGDYVRLEVELGLARGAAIRVVPVLVDGAVMPTADLLPASIQPLAYRHGIEVRNESFYSDVERLVDDLGGRPSLPPWLGRRPASLTVAFLAVILAGLIGSVIAGRSGSTTAQMQGNINVAVGGFVGLDEVGAC